MSSFPSIYLFDFENRLLPYSYVMIGNQEEYPGIRKEGLEGVVDQQGSPNGGRGPNQVNFGVVLASRSCLC